MIHVNLLEYRELQKKMIIQKQFVVTGAALALSFFLMMFLSSSQNRNIKKLKSITQKKQSELDRLKAQVQQVTEYESKEIRLKDMLTVIKRLKVNQTGTYKILDELNIQMPTEVWLEKFSEKQGKITIAGYSFSNIGIASFMKNLENSSHFVNIELVGSEQSTISEKKIKKFTIICSIRTAKQA